MADPDEALIEAIAEALRTVDDAALVETNFGQLSATYDDAAHAAYAAMVAHLGLVAVADEERASLVAEVERLRGEYRQLDDAFRRVLANEGNHYDRYWQPPGEPLTSEWLDETKAKMREALTDAFCDDAAAVMLELVAEVERLRAKLAKVEALHVEVDRTAGGQRLKYPVCAECAAQMPCPTVRALADAPAEQRGAEVCGHDVGDPPEVCRCLLPRGHSGLHSCKHTERAEGGA